MDPASVGEESCLPLEKQGRWSLHIKFVSLESIYFISKVLHQLTVMEERMCFCLRRFERVTLENKAYILRNNEVSRNSG